MPATEESRNRAGQLGVIDRDCRGENKSGHRVTCRVTLLSWPWGSRTDEIKLTLPALGVSRPVPLKYHLLMEGAEDSQAAVASDRGQPVLISGKGEGDLSPLRLLFPCFILGKGLTHTWQRPGGFLVSPFCLCYAGDRRYLLQGCVSDAPEVMSSFIYVYTSCTHMWRPDIHVGCLP